MNEEILYISLAFLTLFSVAILLLLIVMKRGKKITQQSKLLSKRDNAADKYLALEQTLQKVKKEAAENYSSLEDEVKNIKQELDQTAQNLDQVAQRLIKDYVDFSASQITATNYVELKNRIEEVFDFCTAHGFEDEEGLKKAQTALKHKFEVLVRKNLEKQSQEELKEQMREERSFQEKVKLELERLLLEKTQLERDLQNAIHAANEKQSQQIQLKLNQVNEHIERANQQSNTSTTSGFVYILSNYGSYGEGVYKIGFTQSEQPEEEIKNLGESTPFPYDIHALINSMNAEKLFLHLQLKLKKFNVNKVNLDQNFYASSLEQIVSLCEEVEGKIAFQVEPEALEYFQSMETTAEDLEYLMEVKTKVKSEENK